MPFGFERLNERLQRPNVCINFIKPLASSSAADQAIAKDFLERIAAQCYPVMKRDTISVMSLEEFPPNREFLGRNFNAGEVVQLVLKDKAGHWLSFNFVQMVMMHELAHCKEMNHSSSFWRVRERYADHMRELWRKRYTGEGLWGRGQNLTSGRFVHDHMPNSSDIPENLCGGTYRRARGRKRKQEKDAPKKPSLSYAERQQRRISKKFGVHGDGKVLGGDEIVRGAIESMGGGKRHQRKPKVASSKRSRDLRANAALARFEAAKSEQQKAESCEESEYESDWWSDGDSDFTSDRAFDGTIIKDDEGFDLFKICGDEKEQLGGQDEMRKLWAIATNRDMRETSSHTICDEHTTPQEDDSKGHGDSQANQDSSSEACPVCSFNNDLGSAICMACGHVLYTTLVSNHWRCRSSTCLGSKYINPGDAGRCGLCGTSKSIFIDLT